MNFVFSSGGHGRQQLEGQQLEPGFHGLEPQQGDLPVRQQEEPIGGIGGLPQLPEDPAQAKVVHVARSLLHLTEQQLVIMMIMMNMMKILMKKMIIMMMKMTTSVEDPQQELTVCLGLLDST